jgi:hypothetical protein
MLKTFSITILLIGLLFLFNLSCEEKSTQGGERTDFEAIKAIANENPDIFKTDIFDTQKDTTVNPVFFREITSRDFDLDTARRYDADSAHPVDYIHAAWGDNMEGIFHHFIDEEEYTKSFSAHSVMSAYFEKWGENFDPHRGWLLRKISSNVITSSDTISRQIYTLRITSSGMDTVLNEIRVLNLVRIANILNTDSTLHFGMGDTVTFTIEPKYSDNVLFLHVGEDGNFKKIPFVDNGDESFSASWVTTTDSNIAKGYKHAFVDVISPKTLTDTTSKYDSKAWGIIYRIK